MANGYERQDTTGKIDNGQPIDADIFNAEYDAIKDAFNASDGHNHDGTAGGGAPIESIGPSQELEVTSAAVFPKNNNLIDHGKTALRWKDGYYGGTVYAEDAVINDDVSIGGDLTVTGNATIAGNLTFGDAATDTVDFQADVDSDIKPETTGTYNLGSSTQEWNNLWLDGTANVDNLTVDENGTVAGTFDVTGAVGIDGDFDINTTKFTIAAASGNTAIAGTLDVTGEITATAGVTGNLTGNVTGNLDGVIGGTTPAAGTFTDVSLSGDITVNGTVDGVDIAARDAILTTTTTLANAALPKTGGTMTGNITFNSTQLFDGRDVSVDGAKLDNIEANADVTDTTNVTAAGALMDSELTNEAAVKAINQGLATTDDVTFGTVQFDTGLTDGTLTMTGFVDEDDMSSNSATLIPTQQSVKAYVDAATVAATDLSATTVTATTLDAGTADVETLDLGGGAGAGWVLQQNTSTNDLEFIYNGVVQAKLTSAGTLQLNADVDSEAF